MQEKNPEQLVRKYYDRNTGRFLLFARSALPKAIHQPVYEHPAMSLEEALHTHHRKILARILKEKRPHNILDLGCGVGESMIYLAQHTSEHIRYYGITLSGGQAKKAVARIQREKLQDRCHVLQGSFQSLPQEVPDAGLAFAIEAFVHSPDARAFFSQVARHLEPEAQLILFDDFLLRLPEGKREEQIVTDMRTSWLAHGLMTETQAVAHAKEAGLVLESTTHLSSRLKLNRVRDKFVRLLVPFARVLKDHSEYCRFLIGGDARQRAYRSGLLEYGMLVFVKQP